MISALKADPLVHQPPNVGCPAVHFCLSSPVMAWVSLSVLATQLCRSAASPVVPMREFRTGNALCATEFGSLGVGDGQHPALGDLGVGDAEDLRDVLFAFEMFGRPGTAESPRAGGEHE